MLIPHPEERKKIVTEIAQEETAAWKDVPRQDADAIYLEDQPAKALEKLLTLHESVFNERLVYVKHLAELLGVVGDEGVRHMSAIFEIIVSH